MRKERPFDCIAIAKSSCCDDIGYLEEGNLHALGKALIEMEDIKGNQGCGKKDNPEIALELLIFKASFKLTNQQVIVEIEVDPES